MADFAVVPWARYGGEAGEWAAVAWHGGQAMMGQIRIQEPVEHGKAGTALWCVCGGDDVERAGLRDTMGEGERGGREGGREGQTAVACLPPTLGRHLSVCMAQDGAVLLVVFWAGLNL